MIVGLVGKPSSGKSTFFKAATLAEAEIADYPFTTIEKNEGFGFVKVECAEREFGVKCEPKYGYCLKGNRFVPVKLIDVAGLVPGAHLGKGRGNQFLDDLRQADVLIQVVDVSGSTNEKGERVERGSYDPAEDIRFLEEELDMWYLGILKKGWEKFARTVVQEKKQIHLALGKQLSGLKVGEEMVEEAIKKLGLDKEKPNQWGEPELKGLATELRKRTKPMVIAGNKIDVLGALENFNRLEKEFPEHRLVACSAESELALREAAKSGLIDYVPGEKEFKVLEEEKLNERQKKGLDFVKRNVLEKTGSTGVQQVLDKAVFERLKYIWVFPVENSRLADKDGRVLPDCFLLPPQSTAWELAYAVHTDIGRNFIRAIDRKTKKRVGKEHVLGSGDVIEIVAGK